MHLSTFTSVAAVVSSSVWGMSLILMISSTNLEEDISSLTEENMYFFNLSFQIITSDLSVSLFGLSFKPHLKGMQMEFNSNGFTHNFSLSLFIIFLGCCMCFMVKSVQFKFDMFEVSINFISQLLEISCWCNF